MIYLDVEIKKREFLSRLYLASLLADTGSIVLIGKRLSAAAYIDRYPSSLLVRKNARLSGLKLTAELVNHGIDVVSIDEEGFMVDSLKVYLSFDNPHQMVRLISKYFLWGLKQKITLSKKYGSTQKKFFSFGNPRVVLWKNRYFGYFDQEATTIKSRFGRFLLVSSNFGLVTNSDFVTKNISYALESGDESTSKVFEQRLITETRVFLAFIDISIALAKQGRTVVFRPHPSDNIEYIKDCLSNSGVIIDSSSDIAPWLMACDFLIHNCCSSGIEAHLMGTNVIAFEPSGISLLEDRAVNDLGLIVSSIEELEDVVSRNSCEKFEEVGTVVDTDASLGEMVEIDPDVPGLVEELKKSEKSLNSSTYINKQKLRNCPWIWIWIKQKVIALKQCLMIGMGYFKNKYRLGSRYAAYNKFPTTTLEEVWYFLDRLKQQGLVSKDVTASMHDINCFKIEKIKR